MTPSLYFNSRQKRVLDIALSLFLIAVFSPLLIGISILNLVTAGSPILFFQKRVGKEKKVFTILKFRTMYIEAEKDRTKFSRLNEAPLPMFKASNDPRFVGIGHYLSKSGLDELPQLFNILKGEMSFVGPRPLPVYEAKQLGTDWNFRYRVRPGIFSEWSLSSERHKSLKTWKELEVATLQLNSVKDELKLMYRNVRHHLKYLLEASIYFHNSKS